MLKINKKGDEPALWVLIGLISFILVAITVLSFVSTLKDNSSVYKKQYSTDLALVKEELENIDELTLVIYKIDMLEEYEGKINPNIDKTLYFEFLKNRVIVKEEQIATGTSFAYFDNVPVVSEDTRFSVNKDEVIFFLKTGNELKIGSTSKPDNIKKQFYSILEEDIEKEHNSRNVIIMCLACDDDEKVFAQQIKGSLSSVSDKSIILEYKDEEYEDIFTDKELKEEIKKSYISNSIVLINGEAEGEIKYLDYFSSKVARELKHNLEAEGARYSINMDLDLYELFSDKIQENSGFLIVTSGNRDVDSNLVYSSFDFLKKESAK